LLIAGFFLLFWNKKIRQGTAVHPQQKFN